MRIPARITTLVLIGCLLNNGIKGDEDDDQEPKPNCVDGTYCYLIQGDIARQSAKYGKDATQYYKKAEEQFVKYKESIHSEDEALKKACEETHNKCSEEAAQMAVEGLDYPAAYQKPCNYRTYSRNVFGCQNIKEWPENLRTSIPDNHKACNIVCDMDETKEYALSNGQKMFRSGDQLDVSTVSSDVLEARLTQGISRAISHQYPSVTDKSDGWKEFEYCPNDQWVRKGFNISNDTPAYGVSFYCGVSNQTAQFTALEQEATGRHAKQKDGKRVIAWDGRDIPYEVNTTVYRCQVDSFVVGIEVALGEVANYGKAVRQVNPICSQGGFSAIPTAAPGNPEVRVCTGGSAMCAVKIKVQKLGRDNVEFMVDVGIGCCGGDVTKCPDCFSKVTEKGNKAPRPEIFDFQTTNDFLFWDQVFGTHISRYNRFYTPFTIADETKWKQSNCSTGTFVSEVEIRNPRSGYHLGRRIRQMIFTCTAPDGSNRNTLDMYDRLTSGGYTLGEHEPSRTKTIKCDEGAVAQSIKLEYYLDRERSDSEQSLVNAWGVGLNCIGEFSGDYQGAYFQAVSSASLNDYDMVLVAADCNVDGIDSDIAVCGFEHKVEHSRKGTYEGLFLRVLCCAKV